MPRNCDAMSAAADNLSHVVGETHPPLRHTTIPALLHETAKRHALRDAVVVPHDGHRLNYSDLVREVDAIATGLLDLGIVRSDRVGIWSPNRLEWVLTQFATARIGAVLVNINPAYRLAELEFALNKVTCKALVTAERFKSSDYLGMMRTLTPEMVHCPPGRLVSRRLPHLRCVIAMGNEPGPGCLKFSDVACPPDTARLDAIEIEPSDAINIQFTSGTTGTPKGATLSHHNIVNNAGFVTDRMRFSQDDRLCIPVLLTIASAW